MIGCLRAHVRMQPIVTLYLEFETVFKVYNIEARTTSMPVLDSEYINITETKLTAFNI